MDPCRVYLSISSGIRICQYNLLICTETTREATNRADTHSRAATNREDTHRVDTSRAATDQPPGIIPTTATMETKGAMLTEPSLEAMMAVWSHAVLPVRPWRAAAASVTCSPDLH